MHGQIAIILLAGKSERFGGNTPKQYLKPDENTPLFLLSLPAWLESRIIDSFLFVVPKGDEEKVHFLLRGFPLPYEITAGGASREESVFNALEHIAKSKNHPQFVYIHDGDRPNISKEMILSLKDEPAILVTPSEDALLLSDKKGMRYLKRESVKRIQTPEHFPFEELHRAFLSAKGELSKYHDEGEIWLKYCREPLKTYPGSKKNVKITTREDYDTYRKGRNDGN